MPRRRARAVDHGRAARRSCSPRTSRRSRRSCPAGQRHHRHGRQAHDQRRADPWSARRSSTRCPAPDRREGLHGRPHPAELADRQRRRHRLAGLLRASPTRSATWCSAPTRSRARSTASRRSSSRLQDVLVTFGLEQTPAALRARAHRRAGRRRGQAPGSHGAVVPEPRLHRRRERHLRRQRRQDARSTPRRAPASTACTSRPARAPTPPTATATASTWSSTSRASTGSRARSGRGRQGSGRRRAPPVGAVGARQRRRRLHRPRGVPQPRAAGPLLPRGHGDGQAARPADRARHLLHAAHGGRPRRPRLVHRPDHAGQPRLPDGAADQERPDALVPDHRVPGPRPRARQVRLQGRRRDVGVLPGARGHRRRRPAHRQLRRPAVGVPAVPAGPRRRPPRRGDPRRGRAKIAECEARGVFIARGHGDQPVGHGPRARRQGPRALRGRQDVDLLRAARGLRRHAARGRSPSSRSRPTARTTSCTRPPARCSARTACGRSSDLAGR
jgi:hypothetical protein